MSSVGGEPGGRGREDGVTPDLVLLKAAGVGGCKNRGRHAYLGSIFPFQLPALRERSSGDRNEEERGGEVVAAGGEKEVSDAQTESNARVQLRRRSPRVSTHNQRPSRTAHACVDQTIFSPVRLQIPHHAGYHWKDNFIMFGVNEIVISTTRNVMH